MTEETCGLEGKERFDACMKQADFFSKKVYNRQAYQWKVTIGLWTLIAASIGFLPGKDVTLPWWLGPFVLLTYTFIWVRGVANKNRNDQARAYLFRDLAEKMLLPSQQDEKPVVKEKGKIGKWVDEYFYLFTVWAHLFEFTVTATLIVLAYCVLKIPFHLPRVCW